MDTHIPTKLVTNQNKTPWLTPKIKRLHRRKQRAFNRARKRRSFDNLERFRQLRKDTHMETKHAYGRYVKEYCLESKKNFWSFIKNLKRDSAGIPALKKDGLLISENRKKAEVLNDQFRSVFTKEDMKSFPSSTKPCTPDIHSFKVTTAGIEKPLKNLNPNKAAGIDAIPPRILKENAHDLAPILAKIFQASLDTGKLPSDWKNANVSPIFKKGDKTKASNYRPVSLTSVCCKVLEHVLHSQIMKHLDKYHVLTDQQHGFRKGHSCETQLIQTIHDLTSAADKRTQTDVIIMDFSKAFDTVPHNRLISKLKYYGINGKIITWISSFLKSRKQRVVVGGEHSQWVKVESGVPQGTVLGPLLFLLYINDLPENLNSTVRLFADDCVLYNTISTPQDAAILQRDLETLSTWEQIWQMSFNPEKCFVLRIPASRSPIISNYTLGNSTLQETSSHSYLGVDISNNLKWDTHIDRISASANKTIGFIRRNLRPCTVEARSTAYKALVRQTLEYCCSVWDPYQKGHIKQLGMVQRRAARMVTKNYNWENSASKLMTDLKWENLSARRQTARLSVFHKALGGHLTLPASDPTYHQTSTINQHFHPTRLPIRRLQVLIYTPNGQRLE